MIMSDSSAGDVISDLLRHLSEFSHAVEMAVLDSHGAVLHVNRDLDLGDSQAVQRLRDDLAKAQWERNLAACKKVWSSASVVALLAHRLLRVLPVAQLDPDALPHCLSVEVRRLERFAQKFHPGGRLRLGRSNQETVLLMRQELEPLRQIQDRLVSLLLVAPHVTGEPLRQTIGPADAPRRRRSGRPKLDEAKANHRREMVARWKREKGRLSQKEFCADNGITKQTLAAWIDWESKDRNRNGTRTKALARQNPRQ
jgi:hypothetical protein